MVYSTDSVHLNTGHMYPTQFMQIFGSASCDQWLNQIYISSIILWHIIGKRRLLAFQRCVFSSNSVTCIDRSLICERKSAVGTNTISPISTVLNDKN